MSKISDYSTLEPVDFVAFTENHDELPGRVMRHYALDEEMPEREAVRHFAESLAAIRGAEDPRDVIYLAFHFLHTISELIHLNPRLRRLKREWQAAGIQERTIKAQGQIIDDLHERYTEMRQRCERLLRKQSNITELLMLLSLRYERLKQSNAELAKESTEQHLELIESTEWAQMFEVTYGELLSTIGDDMAYDLEATRIAEHWSKAAEPEQRNKALEHAQTQLQRYEKRIKQLEDALGEAGSDDERSVLTENLGKLQSHRDALDQELQRAQNNNEMLHAELVRLHDLLERAETSGGAEFEGKFKTLQGQFEELSKTAESQRFRRVELEDEVEEVNRRRRKLEANITDATRKIAEVQQQVTELEDERDKLKSDLEDRNESLIDQRKALADKDVATQEANAALDAERESVRQLELEIEGLKGSLEQNQQETAALNAERKQMRSDSDAQAAAHDKTRASLTATRRELGARRREVASFSQLLTQREALGAHAELRLAQFETVHAKLKDRSDIQRENLYQLHGMLDELDVAKAKLQEESEQAQSQLSEAQAAREKLQLILEEHNNKIDALEKELRETTDDLGHKSAEATQLSRSINEREAALTSLQQEHAKKIDDTEALQKELNEERGQSRELRDALASAESEIEAQSASLSERESDLVDLTNEHSTKLSEIDGLREHVESLDDQLTTTRDNVEHLGSELSIRDEEIEILSGFLAQKGLEREELEAELMRAKQKELHLKHQLHQSASRLTGARAEAATLIQQLASASGYTQTLASESSDRAQRIGHLEAELAQARSGLDAAAIVRRAMDGDATNKQRLMDRIERSHASLADSLGSMRGEREQLNQIITDLQHASKQRQAEYDELFATLSETRNSLEEDISTRSDELEKLRTEHIALEEQLAEREQELEARSNELSALRQEHTARSASLDTTSADLIAREEELEKLCGEHEAQATKLSETEAKLAERVRELETRNSEFTALQEEHTARGASLDTTNADLIAREEELERLRGEHEAQTTKLSETEAKLAERVRELETRNSELTALQEEHTARGASLDTTNADLTAREEELERLRGEHEALQSLQKETQTTLEQEQQQRSLAAQEASDRIDNLSAEITRLSERADTLDNQRKELRERIEEEQEQKGLLIAALEKAEADREESQDQIVRELHHANSEVERLNQANGDLMRQVEDLRKRQMSSAGKTIRREQRTIDAARKLYDLEAGLSDVSSLLKQYRLTDDSDQRSDMRAEIARRIDGLVRRCEGDDSDIGSLSALLE